MSPAHLVAALAAVFTALLLYGYLATPPDDSAGLRLRYLKLVRLSRAEGEAKRGIRSREAASKIAATSASVGV